MTLPISILYQANIPLSNMMIATIIIASLCATFFIAFKLSKNVATTLSECEVEIQISPLKISFIILAIIFLSILISLMLKVLILDETGLATYGFGYTILIYTILLLTFYIISILIAKTTFKQKALKTGLLLFISSIATFHSFFIIWALLFTVMIDTSQLNFT